MKSWNELHGCRARAGIVAVSVLPGASGHYCYYAELTDSCAESERGGRKLGWIPWVASWLVCPERILERSVARRLMARFAWSSCWAVRSAYFTAFHRHRKNSTGTYQSTADLIAYTTNPPLGGLSRGLRL